MTGQSIAATMTSAPWLALVMPHLIPQPGTGQVGWFNGLNLAERSLTTNRCGLAHRS
jgi:hypothetical protein